jgi:hypothetical protein
MAKIVTRVAVVAHPEGGRSHVTLTDLQRKSLQRLCAHLDKYQDSGKIVVFTTTAPAASLYSNCIAVHLGAGYEICDGLFRAESGDLSDGCECMSDYFMSPFRLVVAVVAKDTAAELAKQLAVRMRRGSPSFQKYGAIGMYLV